MSTILPRGICIVAVLCTLGYAHAREWTSSTGAYKLEAELVSFNDTTAVLKRAKGRLVSVELADLSEADQAYVKSKEAAEQMRASASEFQTWTSKSGMKVRGRVLAYGKKTLNVQRQLGKVLINDQPFARIDELHQRVILAIISHLENENFDKFGLEKWARKLGPNVKSYPLEGVLLELESGDIVGAPFFLFAPEDLAVLEPGWKHWLETGEDEEARQREDLMVQSTAMQYHQENQQQQQIEMLKLEMLGRATGLITVWEVMLEPAGASGGRRTSVMVQADNSELASQMVLQRYPGYRIIGVKRSRRL